MVLPIARIIAAAALSAPLMANAVVYQFNASLNAGNEVGTGSTTTATGIATLFYNDFGTVSLADDAFDFSMSVFGLTGGSAGSAATGFHIHGPATTAQNAGILVNLALAPFVSLNSGSTLLVGGSGATPPPVPSSSFLATLQGGLAYVNVHTTLNPGGAVRGQLVQVTAVPEPATVAMLAAGLGLVGAVVRRKRKAAATRA